jgi:hypothetical protein
MNDQADVVSMPAMSLAYQTFMLYNRVCPSLGHVLNGVFHVDNARYRPDRYPVIHGDDHGIARVAVDNSFQSDFFPKDCHDSILPFDIKSKKRAVKLDLTAQIKKP